MLFRSELLLSRNTVNKYDFMSLTPFAFGISPELSAENKRKRDIRWREFEGREAITKLDPLHQAYDIGGIPTRRTRGRVDYPNI